MISGDGSNRDEGDFEQRRFRAGALERSGRSPPRHSRSLKVSVRCIPFDQQLPSGAICVLTGKPATVEAIFAKAY